MRCLRTIFECPSCGNEFSRDYPADDIMMLKRNICAPEGCACGRKTGFRTLEFHTVNFEPKIEIDPLDGEDEKKVNA